MRMASHESMNCRRQDTVRRRPGRRCLSAIAFSKLLRRPHWPTAFHATGAQTLPLSVSPLVSPKATAMLVGWYPYRPATTDRFTTQNDNVIPVRWCQVSTL